MRVAKWYRSSFLLMEMKKHPSVSIVLLERYRKNPGYCMQLVKSDIHEESRGDCLHRPPQVVREAWRASLPLIESEM
jgi:hypothetical protein